MVNIRELYNVNTRLSPETARLERATLAENRQAKIGNPYFNPPVSLATPTFLPLYTVAVDPLTPSEHEAAEWLSTRHAVKAYRRRSYGRAKHAEAKTVKLPVGGVSPSQLWPAEIKLACGFQPDSSDKQRFKAPDYATMTLEQLIATQGKE